MVPNFSVCTLLVPNLVLLFTMVVTSFRQAWWPISMDALGSSDGPLLFRAVGRLYMGLGVVCIVSLTALSPWLI